MKPEILALYERHRNAFVPDTFDALELDGPVVYDRGTERTFYHSGDFGDIIYALPTIRALGGGRLILGPEINLPAKVRLRQRMNRNSSELLRPLLEIQPYIHSVSYSKHQPVVDYDLNQFREELMLQQSSMREGQRMLNLAECHLKRFHLRLDECENRWLVVDREDYVEERPVVIHRSARWLNPDFPWAKILELYADQAVFVGLSLEHEFFCEQFGVDVPFHPTRNFLELARLIAGSQLYIGNQSLPYSIAEGLKKNSLLEVWPGGPNCLFARKNANYGLGKTVYVPTLKQTMTMEKLQGCPGCKDSAAEPYRNSADIVRCIGCGLVYLRTRMTPESMVAHYQTYADGKSHMKCPERTVDVATSGLRREYFMQLVLKYAAAKGRLLDIGCGWGAFLANARSKGFEVEGVEVCQKMAAFGSDILGLKIQTDQLEDLDFPDNHFDVIVAIHTLEHLPFLDSAMKTVHRILKSGGVFAGIVPNIQSFCSELLKDKWKWLDPNYHYVHFSPETLQKYLLPLNVLKMYTSTGDYGTDEVESYLQEQSSVPLSEAAVAVSIEELHEKMMGEEIHFVAVKHAEFA